MFFDIQGITFPASSQQLALCRSVCQEYAIDPSAVVYVEAHGTGTPAGDGQELLTLDAAYGRDTGVLIGSVKSNMGHSEGASGMMSLLKVLGVITEGTIPSNLHYQGTKAHEPILSGRLKVVDTTRALPPAISAEGPPLIAINNFGFGGTNAHVLCSGGDRPLLEDDALTRFLFARTEEGLRAYFQQGNLNKAAWDLHLRNSAANSKFSYRGVVVPSVAPSQEEGNSGLTLRTARVPPQRPPLAFCFSGQGCQWEAMAQDLWLGEDARSVVFRDTILSATAALPVDVNELFGVGDKWLSKRWSGFGITLVQLGLTAVLAAAGVVPDFIFGHSVGEVACGYADGCTTAQEAARIAFVRCQLSERIKADGLMLVAGLDYESAIALLEPYRDTVVACHNSPDGVTLSGSVEEVSEVATQLQAKGIFAKIVPTDGIAYHSKFFKNNSAIIEDILAEVITDPPVRRTSRWLSTSCDECRSGQDHECSLYPSAAYHTKNITGQVNFEPVVRSLPAGVVILEIGPHALLKSIIKRCRAAEVDETPVILGAMQKDHSGVAAVAAMLDSLWLEGVHFSFPKVNHMVPVRHRVNMQWDHDNSWRVPSFEDFALSSGSSSSMKITFDLAGKDAFLMDHIIDGRALLPATAHVYCAWMAYGTPDVHFVDVKILAAIMLDGESVTLTVSTDDKHWKIHHDDKLVSQGSLAAEYQIPSLQEDEAGQEEEEEEVWVDKDTVYARFARFGYEYGEHFQVIEQRSLDAHRLQLGTACHWIAYLDNVLQAFLDNPSGLSLPTAIGAVSIRCEEVQDASRLLVRNKDLHSFGNKDVVIRNLKTSIMRKVHKTPSIRGVEFVPYGEHVVADKGGFKRRLVTHLASTPPPLPPPSPSPTAAVEGCLESLQGAAEEAAAAEGGAGACIPQYDGNLHRSNEVLSCAWCEEGLDIMAQVMRQNMGSALSVLRVGAESTPSDDLFRLLSPLMEHEVASQTYKPLSVALEDAVSTASGVPVDVAVVSNALYSSANLASALHSVCAGIAEGGFLVLREHTGPLPCLLWGDRVTPADDTRGHGRWVTSADWLVLVQGVGLEAVVWYVDEASTQLVLLARKPVGEDSAAPPRAVITSRQDLVSSSPTLLVSEDYGHLGFIRSLRKEPGYGDVSLSLTVPSSALPSCADPVQDDSPPALVDPVSQLPVHLCAGGVMGGMHEVPLRSSGAAAVGSNRGFHLRVVKPGDLESLTWVENEVEPNCEVRFCGMNFKDVMLSYGKLASADPAGHVEIGLEFSGLSRESGHPVMGIAAGCMATHIHATEHLLWDVPPSLTLEQACTIPVVYSTVYYALVVKANIRRGQTVLIHSIAGGVGQAAYHVCKYRGVKVIATCSQAKQAWVHEELGIDKALILDSHGLAFRDKVLSLTQGQGVDVVLNSLSGEKLQASLDCVGQYGHFCEIGKYDIQQNMLIGMGIFERNVSIHGFDLSDMFSKPRLWQPVRDLLSQGLQSGEVQPLCLTVFDDPEQALRHVSTGKHIGKVLVRLPPLACDTEAVIPLSAGISRHLRSFRTAGTHLVVGGLGGFGFELVLFLQARGAQRVIIASRSTPKPFQQLLLGASVSVTHVDLKDAVACDAFLAAEGADLVGIWHLGMVLNDSLYDNMSPATWDQTVTTKADICKHLDTSSRTHCPALQHFVMWSSVSALFGNPGQTNYAYANSAMEGVCLARKDVGLPGVAIQWGFIGAVGVLVKNQATNSSLGFTPQHIDSCLESLPAILGSDHAVVSCYIRQLDSAEEADGAKVLSTSQRVARVLGLDPGKINSTDMLSALGMDSLQSVEISNVLKAAGQVKPLDVLRYLTWTEILSFDREA